ncbi:MAG: cell division protein FtsQ/DivIB [Candidatus Kapaibacteriales bacterium]
MNNFYSYQVNHTKTSSPFFLIIFFVFIIFGIIYIVLDFENNNKQLSFLIRGLKYSSDEQIDSILTYTSKGFKSKLDIIKSVENLQYVESCNIFTINPETLIVEVKEKIPIGKFVDSIGKTYFFDKTGCIYQIPNIKRNPQVPLINFSMQAFPEIVKLINFLSELQNSILDYVDEISYDDNNYLLICKSSRTKILLPKENVLGGLTNFSDLFDKVGASKIFNASLIDLKLNDRIIVK